MLLMFAVQYGTLQATVTVVMCSTWQIRVTQVRCQLTNESIVIRQRDSSSFKTPPCTENAVSNLASHPVAFRGVPHV